MAVDKKKGTAHMSEGTKGIIGIILIFSVIVLFAYANHQSEASTSTQRANDVQQTSTSQSSISPFADPSQFTYTQFANVIGGYRIEKGISALVEDPSLDAAARNHAYDMQINHYSSATSPNGTTDGQRIEDAVRGVTLYSSYWDNICSNATTTIESARLFENIQGEKTLTDPRFDYYGVGIVPNTATIGTCNGYLVIYYASVH